MLFVGVCTDPQNRCIVSYPSCLFPGIYLFVCTPLYSFVLLLLFLCLLCSFTCFSFYFFSILFLIKLKEYCAGGNLRELLDKPYMLTPALRRSIACDIASGLRYLHSWNPPIIHRDLTRFLSSPSYASLYYSSLLLSY